MSWLGTVVVSAAQSGSPPIAFDEFRFDDDVTGRANGVYLLGRRAVTAALDWSSSSFQSGMVVAVVVSRCLLIGVGRPSQVNYPRLPPTTPWCECTVGQAL